MQPRIKRVAAIHDISGFGRSSLTVVIPLFAKMNIQVCPLPTALFSTHGAYKDPTFLDLTNQMNPIMNHWSGLNVTFDAIYSGFLGSGGQVDIVLDFIDKFMDNSPLVVVDPVMGDDGKVYTIIDSGLVDKMIKLVKRADIITPNTTEAAVLLNRKYSPVMDREQAKEMLVALSELGPNIVVLTSIHGSKNSGESRYTGVYDRKNNQFYFDECEYIPQDYPGTGDAFTSLLIGALLKGHSLKKALSLSLQFIETSLKMTLEQNIDPRDGIVLELPLPVDWEVVL